MGQNIAINALMSMKGGQFLREIRQARGLSQEALADLLGLHQATITDIERGKRHLRLADIEKLCDVLDCSPLDFFGPPRHESFFGYSLEPGQHREHIINCDLLTAATAAVEAVIAGRPNAKIDPVKRATILAALYQMLYRDTIARGRPAADAKPERYRDLIELAL